LGHGLVCGIPCRSRLFGSKRKGVRYEWKPVDT
jgi:hypothetical protein